jgi:hypothetical protein
MSGKLWEGLRQDRSAGAYKPLPHNIGSEMRIRSGKCVGSQAAMAPQPTHGLQQHGPAKIGGVHQQIIRKPPRHLQLR